eukprot:TRINITY_DN896_c0_g1_i6.p1 TRINITY_DN896_c0_g1~~TRINITY_DN896_c0_g1_i6.p1  ORF type:complete len:112 (+),score=16.85 TRINITY_DN896_c0_g1_i6:100-435(+)
MQVFDLERLQSFNGLNGKPIYLCVLGKVYNMSSKPQFYGPEAPYGTFAGHDASRCLAKMTTSCEELDKSIEDLNPNELETLRQWRDKFNTTYPVVGLCTVVTQDVRAENKL